MHWPNRPLVSVLLPAYNPGPGLGAAVDSILNQTETRFELILVDDGSDLPIREQLAERGADPRVRVLRRDHGGLVSALNHGLGEATGTYIARMDADDISWPNRFRRQVEWLEARPQVDVVGCLVEHGRGRERDEGLQHYVTWVNSLVTAEQVRAQQFVESPLVHPSVMFRRDLVERFGAYRAFDGPEDYELWLRCLAAGVQIEKVPETLFTWNDLPDRLTLSDARYRPEAFLACKTPYLAGWLAQHNPQHPRVLIWGAGRVTRTRAVWLEQHGVEIAGFIDIDPRKVGSRLPQGPVLHPDDLPEPGQVFVVSYVGSRGAREKIGAVLEGRGYRVCRDYLFAA